MQTIEGTSSFLFSLRTGKRMIFFFALLLFLYTALRAWLLSFTHDESYTFLEYVRKSWSEINHLTYTNNHLLNTWLMKYMWEWFGDSEFALRLPNVLSHLLFLYFSAMLLFHVRNPLLMVAGWLLVNCNPFVLDFFSLARGYGISLGLMMMSLYFLYALFFKANSLKNVLLTFLPMCLAVLANLTLVNVLLSVNMITVVGAVLASRGALAALPVHKKNWWVVIGFSLLITSVFLYFILPLLFSLKTVGNFDFGGDRGFWDDTVYSLIASSLYGTDKWGYWAVFMLKWITVTSMILFCVRFTLWRKSGAALPLFSLVLFFVFFQCFAAIEFQHLFFNIPFSVDRAAVYLIPICSCFVVFASDDLQNIFYRKYFPYLILVPAAGLFAVSVNFRFVHLWEYDSGTKTLVQRLSKEISNSNEKPPVIMVGVDFIYQPSFNYYRLRNKLDKVNPAGHEDHLEKGKDPYYLLLFGDREGYGTLLESNFPAGSCLVKNERIFNFETQREHVNDLEHATYEDTPGLAIIKEAFDGTHIQVTGKEHEFSVSLYDTITVSGPYKKQIALFSTMLHRDRPGANALLVISITRGKETKLWKAISTNEFLNRENIWQEGSYAIDLPDDLEKGDVISAYAWNQGKEVVWADHLALRLYTTE